MLSKDYLSGVLDLKPELLQLLLLDLVRLLPFL